MSRIAWWRGGVGCLWQAGLLAAAVPGMAADTSAVRVKERTLAVYPYELAVAGVEGEAELQFDVDPGGVARDIVVVRANEPAFGFAAKAMLEAWQFEPRIENGKAVSALAQTLKVRFDSASSDVALDASARRLLAELKKDTPDITRAGSLDGVPWAVKTVNPVHPRDLLKRSGVAGEATIDFLVDPNGRVQLPRIVSATQWEFGWAAATALLRFEFTPPMKGGVPTATRMRLPIKFRVPGKPEEKTSS
ncbi:MAG TPA: TonB family protein [Opitutaceae bacterium]|nr:TonB family protein [Opitutaceae bacterium]